MVQPRKRRKTRAQREAEEKADEAPAVTTTTDITDLIGDQVTITMSCEVKSVVEYQSVGCSASLTTTADKADVEGVQKGVYTFLRHNVLEEHRVLDQVRTEGFQL